MESRNAMQLDQIFQKLDWLEARKTKIICTLG